ncbi:unnamed protein product [Ambrosiozyma monospora]|uniref:Elongation of fatty acids protein n=1 Tax=Ambrosiozyma monospora TaxID=43982 RepID=A0A9W7DGS4_AMBMO|nr:unnamed protein product [Ambrosiozyma monospora]
MKILLRSRLQDFTSTYTWPTSYSLNNINRFGIVSMSITTEPILTNTTEGISDVALNITSGFSYWSVFPDPNIFKFPRLASYPLPECPVEWGSYVKDTLYPLTIEWYSPFLCACAYFVIFLWLNKIVKKRQIAVFKKGNPDAHDIPKRLPPAPIAFSKTPAFKYLVLLHNVFLCVFSLWSFLGVTMNIHHTRTERIPSIVSSQLNEASSAASSGWDNFVYSICDLNNGILLDHDGFKGLNFYAYWFYMSKYYEMIDTVIILMKGRQAMFLQIFHHAGAVLCMWTGARFASPPCWIFVVFNSCVHTVMYFYYTLCCLHFPVPVKFKKSLTSFQIIQFIIGACVISSHQFMNYFDLDSGEYKNCVPDIEKHLSIICNVWFCIFLTYLFRQFFVQSYQKKLKKLQKKID